jgi:hypothetical protein
MILAVFGVFLVVLDFYVPMGISIFGFPIAIAGLLMVAAGFLRAEPSPITPDPGKKFCWYCMKQIPEDSTECPNCGLPQHDSRLATTMFEIRRTRSVSLLVELVSYVGSIALAKLDTSLALHDLALECRYQFTNFIIAKPHLSENSERVI